MPWYDVVWFSQCIPRHAFHVWLIMRHKLKTHDNMKDWDMPNNTQRGSLRCALCHVQGDSHTHLFFECPYSTTVLNKVKVFADMSRVPNVWDSIVTFLQPLARRNLLSNIIGKLILGAAYYFIWQERNLRIHKKGIRSEDQLFNQIFDMVKQKILTFRPMKIGGNQRLLGMWNITT